MRRLLGLFLVVSLVLLTTYCTRKALRQKNEALRLSSPPLNFIDDLDLDTLEKALGRQLTYWEKNAPEFLTFGETKIPFDQYRSGLLELQAFLATKPPREAILERVKERFDFYEVYGSDRWGKVLLTSYFEPEIEGSLLPTEHFTQPLYRTPSDLTEVVIPKFDDRFFDIGQMRGRLVPDGRNGQSRLYPYYTRREIDEKGVLKNKRLEIAYADIVDVFFAQIQGSLTIVLSDGKRMALNYADQNGHRYQSVGAYLKDRIPLEEMTAYKVESYLRSLSPTEVREFLYKNPSYVFFDKRDGDARGSLGVEVTAGRTIAADGRFFPKGALAYLQFERPIFDRIEDTVPKEWKKSGQLLFDQDSGGAIRGGGRIDLFWGSGKLAKQSASAIRQDAALYYLAPKIRN